MKTQNSTAGGRTPTTRATKKQHSRDDYSDLLESVREHFANTIRDGRPLFTTKADGLWEVFLGALPAREVPHHTCHACRRFVERYGNLVTIDDDGSTTPVMWGPAPGFYKDAFAAARKKVARSRVTGVFLSSDSVWGHPVTGEWRHMAAKPPASILFRRSALKTAGQVMAEKREECGILQRGLAEFGADVVGQAVTLLESEALYRHEKALGPAKWLAELHAARDRVLGTAYKSNITWLAVATAPVGFCHVRSTMIGTLLEDMAGGMDAESVRRRFAEKMHPLQYQRPSAPPNSGSIDQAEKLIAALGSARSFERRHARLDEIQVVWGPRRSQDESAVESMFGHLRRVAMPEVQQIPAATMTWEKFQRTVLDGAEKIEALVPTRGAFVGMVTATNQDAPPILQWDREDVRNPVSWYLYSGGSPAAKWAMAAGTFVTVNAVSHLPSMWQGGYEHQGCGVILVLDGCRDMAASVDLCLFPEILRSDYREIRSTIEAYSKSRKLTGAAEASACGLDLRKGGNWNQRMRVTSNNGKTVAMYDLDRWD